MTKARDLANAADVLDDVSATELSYVNGVTSAIQTQIDSKIGSASAISPTLIDAKGDLLVGSANDTAARLAVGTNNYVLTADSSATNGVKWAAIAAGGKVLQVVQGTYSTETSTTSGTYVDTNLSVSITPSSSSSKVLVLVSQQYCVIGSGNNALGAISLYRGSSKIVTRGGDSHGGLDAGGGGPQYIGVSNIVYLDSPATTSSTTYKTQMYAQVGTMRVQHSNADSIIVAIEIGA